MIDVYYTIIEPILQVRVNVYVIIDTNCKILILMVCREHNILIAITILLFDKINLLPVYCFQTYFNLHTIS